MPFTPFHLGPALALGIPLRKYVHAPTFILANVAVDIEPFIVLLLRLDYPLHGYLHTFLFALLFGLAIGFVMFYLEKFFHPLYSTLLLEPTGIPPMSWILPCTRKCSSSFRYLQIRCIIPSLRLRYILPVFGLEF